MFYKIPTILPIAMLLGALSAAPALAQPRSHHIVQPLRQIMVSPLSYGSGSDAYSSYAMQPGQGERRSLGEVPALPWVQDPDSPRG
jgi:hypothetical protein